ncbi:MAG: hypothetical protein Q8S12_00475 [Hydrogenophaga sp.]|uniref:hypothetical protein n=1 Tax=Hydrogenophaga sp. TaxID=1904254 RepID=UPI0027333844|nr:hypothetical protein [Hydrogenophaga sp.]MDP3625041.1 hypothetical protein [Hydrogenophaga sp.]
MATDTTPVQPESDDDMRRAWRMFRLPSWPATFEQTIEDPLRLRLVQMHAHRLAKLRAAAPCPAPVRVPERRSQALPSIRPTPAGYVDHKRAAAGDRDD